MIDTRHCLLDATGCRVVLHAWVSPRDANYERSTQVRSTGTRTMQLARLVGKERRQRSWAYAAESEQSAMINAGLAREERRVRMG
jgi:hypothetical protein